MFNRPAFLGQVRLAGSPRRLALSGLQDDITWFQVNRINLAQQYAGQWLLVKDKAVRGSFSDFQAAYNAGASLFGTEPFLVKQALEKDIPIREARIQ